MAKDFFCVMPWIHAQMSQDGSLQPCYEFRGSLSTMENGLLNAFSGKDFEILRREMLEGKIPEGCRACVEIEARGGASLRLRANESHSQEVKRIRVELTPSCLSLDLRFSNKCNYRCRICGPEGSTAWTQEISGSEEQLIEATSDKELLRRDLDQLLPRIQNLSFAGGEPLLQPDHYRVLEKLIGLGRTDVYLFYSTNLSVFKFHDWSILSLWKNFNSIEIGLSLDGVEGAGELLRNGMDWNHTKSQVRELQKEVPHAKISVLATLSVLNSFHLTKAIETWMELGWVKESGDLILKGVSKNSQYELKILNPSERKQLLEHYDQWFKHIASRTDPSLLEDIRGFIRRTFEDLEAEPCWHEGRGKFRYSVLYLDKLRHEKTIKFFPEFFELLYEPSP